MDTSPIESLKTGISTLLSRQEALERENAELSRRLSQILDESARQQQTIEQLKERIEKLQLDTAFSNASPDRTEARRQISRMMKQIDRCIALLDEEEKD